MNFQRGGERDDPEINLIPLIDVILVILIFLLLTTSFSKISGLEIALPSAETAEVDAPPNDISVAVDEQGGVFVNGNAVVGTGVDAIASALGRARPAQGEPVVVINADAKAAHQRVVDVMQAAQRAGLPHIQFAIQTQAE